MKRMWVVLAVAVTITACGGGGVDKKAEAHVCGYLIPDATDGIDASLADLNNGNGAVAAAAEISQTTRQIREDVSTLGSGDPIRTTAETLAKDEDGFAAGLRSNGDIGATGKALQGPGDKLQTLCRAVTP